MSKKTKRSKKGRKSKGFESPSSKRGRDEVTGLFVEVNGEKIYSDVTYSQTESRQGKALASFWGEDRVFSEGGSALFEVELGKSAITFTLHTIGEVSVDGTRQSSPNYRQRDAFIGEFRYGSSGAFEGGSVREVADWSYGQVGPDKNRIGEWSSVDQGSVKVSSIYDLFTKTKSLEYRPHDYLADYGDNLIEGDPKQNFYNFESSKYFENGWWDNPFDSNLI